jgi:hypothetical protein
MVFNIIKQIHVILAIKLEVVEENPPTTLSCVSRRDFRFIFVSEFIQALNIKEIQQ